MIAGVFPHSFIDYPGKIACVIFLSGCNFRCPFCQNPELVNNSVSELVPEEEVFGFLESYKKWLEGVCITGGEPTIHGRKLFRLIEKIKELGFPVKLDTNGYLPEVIEELIIKGLVDYIAMDVKHTFEKYSVAAGVNIEISRIKDSIEIIKNFPEHEFRTTLVPGMHNEKDILEIASYLKGAKIYYLQRFNGEKTLSPEFRGLVPYPREFFDALAKKCNTFVETRVRY